MCHVLFQVWMSMPGLGTGGPCTSDTLHLCWGPETFPGFLCPDGTTTPPSDGAVAA